MAFGARVGGGERLRGVVLGDRGGVSFDTRPLERRTGRAHATGTDTPARGREAVAVAGDGDDVGVRQHDVERAGPVAFDGHGGREQHVEEPFDFFMTARTCARTGSAPSAAAARPRLAGTLTAESARTAPPAQRRRTPTPAWPRRRGRRLRR